MIIEDLREYLFPIYLVKVDKENNIIFESRKYLGTAFFVSKTGDALTACHVIPSPDEIAKDEKLIAVSMQNGEQVTMNIIKALVYSDKDLAMIRVGTSQNKYFEVSDKEILSGTDISVLGFPSHNLNSSGLELRFLKGHVTLSHKMLELNFAIPAGMSGAPVIEGNKVIGIATGRVKCEELIDSYEEEKIIGNNKEIIKIVETKSVIHYGIALPFHENLDHAEPLLNGISILKYLHEENYP
jgi:S1-C subfamily serine protease